MHCQLRWKASLSASALYAAEAWSRGAAREADPLVQSLRKPARLLAEEVELASLPAAQFWRRLVALAPSIEGNRPLVELVLAKTIGPGPRAQALVSPLAGRIADCEAAVMQAAPGLVDELAARIEPLQSEWEARGEGLFSSVARLTDQRGIPSAAEVVAVWPATGGPGTSCLDYNIVLFETPPAGEDNRALPNVVRLAWLAAQLNQDLPAFSEAITRERLPGLAAAAMLPPVLAAAEEIGLARCDRTTLQAALGAVAFSAGAETLLSWWHTYLESRPPWHVALAALDRMDAGHP